MTKQDKLKKTYSRKPSVKNIANFHCLDIQEVKRLRYDKDGKVKFNEEFNKLKAEFVKHIHEKLQINKKKIKSYKKY